MNKEFEGELSWIHPNKLVSENSFNKLESVFLGLGVIYNDLKGFIFLEKTLIDFYRKPAGDEISVQTGNYAGTLVQVKRLISSTVNEFFIFLEKNQDIFAGKEFREILSRIPNDKKDLWTGLNEAAVGNLTKVSKQIKALAIIRNNITFHYDHSGKQLRSGFLSRFLGEYEDSRKNKAYYSIGDTIGDTRFYFADAAAEESMYLAVGKKVKGDSRSDKSIREFDVLMRNAIEAISITISSLLKNYIQIRRNS